MNASKIDPLLRHKVAIIMEGGCIRGVFSDDEHLQVEIVDLDDEPESLACEVTAKLYPVA